MSKKEKRVSIVMAVHNKLEFTKQCLAALFVNTKGFELIIIDDGSTDATPKFIASMVSKHKNIKIITNPEPRGLEYSIYLGVVNSRYQTLCLLHNDVIPLAGWLDKMKEALERGVGAVGAKLLLANDTYQHGGIEFNEKLLPYFRYYNTSLPKCETEKPEEVPAVSTACLLTTKKTIDMVRGLSPELHVPLLQDADFSLKIREIGSRIIYQPKAVLYHFEMEKYLSEVQSDPDLLYHQAQLFIQRWAIKKYLIKT